MATPDPTYCNVRVDTDVFTPGATLYMSVVARKWIGHNLWWLIAGPAIPAVCAIWQPVWIFVALMVALLLYPGVLMLVYYKYALSPWSCLSLYAQQISINGRCVKRTFVPDDKWPDVPPAQLLTLDDNVMPTRYGRYYCCRLQGHSRYEFIIWPADGTVFA